MFTAFPMRKARYLLTRQETGLDRIKPHQLTRQTGAMLATARLKRGWALQKAADEIGCNLSHYWRMENAQGAPSTALAVDIAYALGLSRDQARVLMSEAVPGVGKAKAKAAAKAAA